LVVKSGITGSEMLGVTDVEVDRLKQLASNFSEEDLVRLFHLLAETEKELKDSPHPRFQLEIGLVKLAQASRLRTLDELIKRLEELESRLNGAQSGGVTNHPAMKGPVTKNQAQAGKDQPTARSSAASGAEEPPDFPNFDFTEPEDLYDREVVQPLGPAPPR